jgi:hypothetical protein
MLSPRDGRDEAGLPKPQTQIEFYHDFGEAFIRVDIGWRQWKLAVEYDSAQHWTDPKRRAWDIERVAIFEAMGWVRQAARSNVECAAFR